MALSEEKYEDYTSFQKKGRWKNQKSSKPFLIDLISFTFLRNSKKEDYLKAHQK